MIIKLTENNFTLKATNEYTFKTLSSSPFTFKSKYNGPRLISDVVGDLIWYSIPLSMILNERTTTTETASSITLKASENKFTIKF